jgi:photosystem I subunit 11
MQTAMSSRMAAPCRLQKPSFGSIAGLRPRPVAPLRLAPVAARAAAGGPPKTVVLPVNGDPYIGMLETPVTSAPVVAGYLSNLPAYRTGVSPLLRGVEIGLAHGLLLPGPFIKLGPLRNVEGVAEISGSLSAAGLVLILTLCLTIYGASAFQQEKSQIGIKTLSGREIQRDPLQSSDGWQKFTAGWLVGGLSGVAWGYILTQILPYYY